MTGRWFFQHGTVASFHCANGMHGVLGGGDRQVMGGGVGGGQHFGIAGGGGALPPQSIILNQAHVEQSAGNGRAGWRWDSRRLALVVTIPNYDAHTQTRVEIVWAQGLLPGHGNLPAGAVRRCREAFHRLRETAIFPMRQLGRLATVARRIELAPETAPLEVAAFRPAIETALASITAFTPDQNAKPTWLNTLQKATTDSHACLTAALHVMDAASKR